MAQVQSEDEAPLPPEKKELIWDYSNDKDTGIKSWSDGQGWAQSPIKINLDSLKDAVSDAFFPQVKLPDGTDENILYGVGFDGHTVKIEVQRNGTGSNFCGLKIDEFDPYQLLQFHFHTPSEHRFVRDGEEVDSPLELHLVHNRGEELAVVGVLFELDDSMPEDAKHPFLRQLMKECARFAEPDGCEKKVWTNFSEEGSTGLDFSTLSLVGSNFVRYPGSLTTPPCTEGVAWVVAPETQFISSAELAFWRKVVCRDCADGNARPCQPLNGRCPSLGIMHVT